MLITIKILSKIFLICLEVFESDRKVDRNWIESMLEKRNDAERDPHERNYSSVSTIYSFQGKS